jgi:hypothetical protein
VAVQWLWEKVQVAWDIIQKALIAIGIAFDLVKAVILNDIAVANMFIQMLWEKVQVAWAVIQAALTGIGLAWQWLSARIGEAINWIAFRIAELMNWFNGMRNSARETTDGVRSAWDTMLGTISTIVSRIRELLSIMWNGLTDGVNRAVNGAQDKIRELLGTVLDISRKVNDAFNGIRNAISNLNPLGHAAGGIVGAATGGIRGGVHMVGEHGPELLHLPAGTRVRSNPDTQRLMSGAGQDGGPTALEVSFAGNTSDALATVIMLLVRQGKIQLNART